MEDSKPTLGANELKHNSVSFAGAVALSAAFMGPAVSVFYDTVPAAGVAGAAFPLSYIFSMVAVLFVASSSLPSPAKYRAPASRLLMLPKAWGPDSVS